MSLAADVREVFAGRTPTWIAAFLDDPADSLTALFTDRWYHGTLNAEDPENLLLDWAEGLDEVEGFAELLDASLASWIAGRWNDIVSDPSPELTWHRALVSVATLHDQLPRTLDVLGAHRSEAAELLGPMTRGVTVDPMGWYWTCLAQCQEDQQLREHWWALCELVPGTPWFHGRIGLLGLRRIPGPDRGRFRESVASALLRFTSALDGQVDARMLKQGLAERASRAAARELRWAYPYPGSWDTFWASHHADLDERPRGWVASVLGEPKTSVGRRAGRTVSVRFDPGWPPRAKRIAERLRAGDRDALEHGAELVSEQENHASATGDFHGVVRTLCQLAAASLAVDPASSLRWAEAARRWDPWDAYAWTSMVQAMSATGDLAGALASSLEAAERFPDNVVARNGLAEALRARNDLQAAETTYRNTIDRFPNNVVARTGLAAVAAARDREAGRAQRDDGHSPAGGGPVPLANDAAAPDERHREPTPTNPSSQPSGRPAESDGSIMSSAPTPSELPLPIRAQLYLARLRSGAERIAMRENLHRQIDALLDQSPRHVELLFTKIELLLDLEHRDEARAALGSLPTYIFERAEFLALSGRLELDELSSRPEQHYDNAHRLEAVVGPWEKAGRQHSALRLNVPLVRLRASALVYDGVVLDGVRRDALRQLRDVVMQSDDDGGPRRAVQRNAQLRTWWRGQVANALPAIDTDDTPEPSYADAESTLRTQSDLLASLERERIDAARFSTSAV